MGFLAANTPAHKALKSLWPNPSPHGQDLPLQSPCRGARDGQMPALLQQGHVVEAIFHIQKGAEMVSSLPLEKVFDHGSGNSCPSRHEFRYRQSMTNFHLLPPDSGTSNPLATQALWDQTIHPLARNLLIFLFISSPLIPKARMGLHAQG